MENKLIVEDWGRIPYKQAWDLQTEYLNNIATGKKELAALPATPRQHYLIYCEHPHVYTIGRTGKDSHLLADPQFLHDRHIDLYHINRGGDITYHGPGQMVVYPILDLECFFKDLHKYIRYLEEVVIRMLGDFGISGKRIPGYTGVWVGDVATRKICAIGIHMSRWVSMHGLAFNVFPDLSLFEKIVPCGILDQDKSVTSLAAELGYIPDFQKVKEIFLHHFIRVFEINSYEKKY